MVKSSLFIALLAICHATFASAQTVSERDCREVMQCQEDFKLNDCGEFAKNTSLQAKLSSCSIEETQKSAVKSMADISAACGTGVKNSVIGFINHVGDIPDHLMSNFNKHIEQNKIAYAICTKKLGYDLSDAMKSRSISGGGDLKLNIYNSCFQVEVARLRDYRLPNLPDYEAIKKAAVDLERKRRCFKAEAQAEVICPALATVVGGGAVGFAAKRAIMAKNAGTIASGSRAVSKTEQELLSIEQKVASTKERKSVKHQQDLLSAADSPWGQAFIRNNNLNDEMLKMGMLDSDKGKLASYWSERVLTKSASSDELLNVLSGQSKSNAGEALKQLMKDSGFDEKSFLPKLPPDEIRTILTKNPALQGYLHEFPGMSEAVLEFNHISKPTAKQTEDFKKRISANLFHNGPHEGFWKFFGNDVLPNTLDKLNGEAGKSFFKGTVFESEKSPSGVIKPKYPGPISAEGLFHTLNDRMSQGSRGGMSKIFSELGGAPVDKNPSIKMGEILDMNKNPWGLNKYKEMFVNNPKQTLSQLKALESHVVQMKTAGQLTSQQVEGFNKIISSAQKRMSAEINFIESNTRTLGNGDFELRWQDAKGNERKTLITQQTPADEALRSLDEFMLAEERRNGDPINELLKTPSRPSTLAATAMGASIAALPSSCVVYKDRPSLRPISPAYEGAR